MGKVSSKDKESKASKQKRWLRSSQNKYLKPGALARLRYNKTKSCTDLGKKRVIVLDDDNNPESKDIPILNDDVDKSPLMLSPHKFGYPPVAGAVDLMKPIRTPKTPRADESYMDSRLESLPMDLLVNILCHLHHDQLKPVFHVSQRIRKAVLFARQFHFNYTTPDRYRQEMLSTMTPIPTEHWPFVNKGDGKGTWMPSPRAPKAPRHAPRPPSRIKYTDVRQIAAVLFQESAFPAACMVPSVLQRPHCKSVASNRALFYEEELCQAVAQNKLR